MIERTRDALWSTAASGAAIGLAVFVYLTFGFEAVCALGAIGALGASVWLVVYLALGEGQDDPRDELLDEAYRLIEPRSWAGIPQAEYDRRVAQWIVELVIQRSPR